MAFNTTYPIRLLARCKWLRSEDIRPSDKEINRVRFFSNILFKIDLKMSEDPMKDKLKPLHDQVRQAMRLTMEISLSHVASKESLNSEDVDWILRLCEELKIRLNNLIPSRKDLHRDLNAALDSQLLKQMLEHAAFDKGDFQNMVNVIFSRLKMLCAPVQDRYVHEQHEKILQQDSFGQAVSILIMESNKVIDEIENLLVGGLVC